MEQKQKETTLRAVQKKKKTNKKENLIERTNLKAAIKKAGYTNESLGKEVGYSGRAIGKIVNGQTKKIDSELMNRFVELLQVTPEYIEGKVNHSDPDLLTAILMDMQDNTLSKYKNTFAFLKEVGIDFVYKNVEDALYMNPAGCQPVYISSDAYWFLVNHIRNYTKTLFTEYYNSPLSFNENWNHMAKTNTKKGVM